jgi:hypothetical protein
MGLARAWGGATGRVVQAVAASIKVRRFTGEIRGAPSFPELQGRAEPRRFAVGLLSSRVWRSSPLHAYQGAPLRD